MEEGIYLLNRGYSPYANNIFHSSPLLLQFFSFIESFDISYLLKICFIIFDLIVCYNLYYIGKHLQLYLVKHKLFQYNESYHKNEVTTSLHSSPYFALIISLIYNLNPFIIAVCVSKSNSNISHALVTSAILFCLNFDFEASKDEIKKRNGKIVISAFILALATVIDVYPILLLPVCIQFLTMKTNIINERVLRKENSQNNDITSFESSRSENSIKICFFYILSFVIGLALFLNWNVLFLNETESDERKDINWDFIKEFYFFMFEV